MEVILKVIQYAFATSADSNVPKLNQLPASAAVGQYTLHQGYAEGKRTQQRCNSRCTGSANFLFSPSLFFFCAPPGESGEVLLMQLLLQVES